MPLRSLTAVLLAVSVAAPLAVRAGGMDPNYVVPIDHPAIDYLKAKADDPITRLARRLQSGEVKLDYRDDGFGYLESVLAALGIARDSQMLVFSKTSFQREHIGPDTPRALYFNDSVAVGFVQGGPMLEFAALDPKEGTRFYTLNNVKPRNPPVFASNGLTCVQCHDSTPTLGVPGALVRSVVPDFQGTPISEAPSYIIDHRSPIADRWGGWYVTGSTGDVRHLGNAIAESQANFSQLERRPPMDTLKGVIDTRRYLEPTSDVVALMTLEHQARMWDLLTRLGWDARIAAADHKPFDESEVEELLRYMLFTHEAKLSAPITGSSGFEQDFEKRGPRDPQGRSLRDYDLKTRMFKYPLSYMVYSEAFDALPKPVLERVYRRLYEILKGRDQSPAYARLGPAERKAILEILVATKKGLPAYFRTGG